MPKDLKVWYQYRGTSRTGSMTLTVEDRIEATIAEFESRNSDMVITDYLDENNNIIEVSLGGREV